MWKEGKREDWKGSGYSPAWTADLRLAEKYGAAAVGVNFSKWVWWRRALVLAEAESRAYDFESKTKGK